jgi:hypothetical protein
MGKKESNWRSSIQFMKDKFDNSSGGSMDDDISTALCDGEASFRNRRTSSDGSALLSSSSSSSSHPSSHIRESITTAMSASNTRMIVKGEHVGSEAVCNGSHMDCTVYRYILKMFFYDVMSM